MKNKLILNNVFVKQSIIHGYGVFAKSNIKPGEIIEECYTLLTKVNDPVMSFYYFKSDGEEFAIPLGFGCIYNHSDQPNATYSYDAARQLMVFEATRFINKGEEILTSYGKSWFESRNMSKRGRGRDKNATLMMILRSFIAVGSIYLLIEVMKYLVTI